ncbi:MAG TPA: rhodanese-like domain-containing protein [Patescibacteria group bacterium]|nr:rhodanese-like domain-containing protein [Patescibacteria group bacterium]
MKKPMQILMAAIVALSFAPLTGAATKDAAKPAEKDPFGSMTVQQVAKKIKDPAVHVYDGNREELYKENHVPGAVRLYSKDIKEGVLPDKKDTTLIFYCHNEL